MKTKYSLLVLLIIFLSLSTFNSCKEGSLSPQVVDLNQQINLKAGESANINSEGLNIKFDSVLSDSRCPLGALCVWEGNANVRILLNKHNDTSSVILNTAIEPKESDIYNNLHIKLIVVNPYPKIDSILIPAKNYSMVFIITKK